MMMFKCLIDLEVDFDPIFISYSRILCKKTEGVAIVGGDFMY